MKLSWTKSLILLGAVAMQSHAIMGIGFQWAPAELKVKAARDTISSGGGHSEILNEQGTSGAQGFGMKFWIDALPFVNLEATEDFQFANYHAALITTGVPSDSTDLKFDSKFPLLTGTPFTARSFTDVAVLYPFLKLPPVISLLTLYAGGGLSYGISTPTLTPGFAKKALTDAQNSGTYNPNTDDGTGAQKAIISAIKNAGFDEGIGWFLQVGTHLKAPIIPIALFADAKYRFTGINPELVSGNGFTVELGGALAF